MRKHGLIAARLTIYSVGTADGEGGCSSIESEAGSRLAPGPNIGRRATMEQYVGLDVSLKDTAISIREMVSGFGVENVLLTLRYWRK